MTYCEENGYYYHREEIRYIHSGSDGHYTYTYATSVFVSHIEEGRVSSPNAIAMVEHVIDLLVANPLYRLQVEIVCSNLDMTITGFYGLHIQTYLVVSNISLRMCTFSDINIWDSYHPIYFPHYACKVTQNLALNKIKKLGLKQQFTTMHMGKNYHPCKLKCPYTF